MSFDMMSFDMMPFGYDVIGSTKCITVNLLIVGIVFFILGLASESELLFTKEVLLGTPHYVQCAPLHQD